MDIEQKLRTINHRLCLLERQENIQTIVAVVDEVGMTTITPNARKVFVRLSVALLGNVTFLTDIKNCLFGDEIVFLLKIDDTNTDGVVTFPDAKYYLTICGEVGIDYMVGTLERFMFHFYFDGTKYVSTQDNC